MMEAVRMWLMSILTAGVLCAVAGTLMPAGPVQRVGKLVCGLVLLCAVLSPVTNLDLEGGQQWLEDYAQGLELRERELEEQINGEMKSIIEQSCAAYIVDKAAELGLTCTARVTCRAEAAGVCVPETAELSGAFSGETRDQMTRVLEQELGIPAERQTYISEEEMP